MPKIKLDKPWKYHTIEKTIDFPAGEHEVFQYIADQAEAEGVISKEASDGDGAAKGRKARDTAKA